MRTASLGVSTLVCSGTFSISSPSSWQVQRQCGPANEQRLSSLNVRQRGSSLASWECPDVVEMDCMPAYMSGAPAVYGLGFYNEWRWCCYRQNASNPGRPCQAGSACIGQMVRVGHVETQGLVQIQAHESFFRCRRWMGVIGVPVRSRTLLGASTR